MLFNSYIFIFAFVPIALIVYFLIGKRYPRKWTLLWLIAISLVFYGWYNPYYVLLLLASAVFNYIIGKNIRLKKDTGVRKRLLVSGIVANILLLGYFKYANFFIENVNVVFQSNLQFMTVILPIAISFFTIQQISYLVDSNRSEVAEHNFIDYCLYITYFPKLIAGPIMRFKDFIPQLAAKSLGVFSYENMAIGTTVFFLGLFKKVILADYLVNYVTPVFDAAAKGVGINFFDAWVGSFAYTFQLYFDFSAYCDMAIGLGVLFGIRVPLNFFSPYKARNPREFWNRWHITLSRFLRDYLYIPLGGNRKGFPRQVINLLIVMTIAGIWHGAGWTFVIWGFLHGFYLAGYHVWRKIKTKSGFSEEKPNRWLTAPSILVTFLLVNFAWVFFRADNIKAAWAILQGMFGLNGIILPAHYGMKMDSLIPGLTGLLENIGVNFDAITGVLVFGEGALVFLFISFIIIWFLPNVQEYMANQQPSSDAFPQESRNIISRIKWRPSPINFVAGSLIIVVSVLGLIQLSNFIYFQF